MIRNQKSMTQILRQALLAADNYLAVEKATGVTRQSLMKFARGEQSIRLDMADKLADYFGIECRQVSRRKGNK